MDAAHNIGHVNANQNAENQNGGFAQVAKTAAKVTVATTGSAAFGYFGYVVSACNAINAASAAPGLFTCASPLGLFITGIGITAFGCYFTFKGIYQWLSE